MTFDLAGALHRATLRESPGHEEIVQSEVVAAVAAARGDGQTDRAIIDTFEHAEGGTLREVLPRFATVLRMPAGMHVPGGVSVDGRRATFSYVDPLTLINMPAVTDRTTRSIYFEAAVRGLYRIPAGEAGDRQYATLTRRGDIGAMQTAFVEGTWTGLTRTELANERVNVTIPLPPAAILLPEATSR